MERREPAAAAINLKRLAAAFCARFPAVGMIQMRRTPLSEFLARQVGLARPRAGRCRDPSWSLLKAA